MKTRKHFALGFIPALLLVALPAAAQQTYAIQGAKIYTLAGPPIENGTVVIRDGKIVAVGADVSVPSGAEVIDAAGLQVYPGLFDPLSRLGLTEVGAVRATVDTSELGRYNPHLKAATAIHPASEHIPVTRANGITHAVSAPGSAGGGFSGRFSAGSGGISGQAAVIHLAGWTIEEMAIETSVAMILSWPGIQTRSFDFSTFSFKTKPFTEAKKEYDKRVVELEDWMEAARHYAQAAEKGAAGKVERDLKLEALVPVVQGKLLVIVMASSKRAIEDAVAFAGKNNLKIIIAGGTDAWKVKDLLKEKNIPVILARTQRLPSREDQPYDRPFSLPGELHAAGIKIAFATFDAAHARTLPYEAANAVPHGLPWEEALKAVTLYPAQMLGVDDRLGTIEVGKLANLIVTDGDPLEIQTQVRYLFINGQPTSTDNKHRRLYEKYLARP